MRSSCRTRARLAAALGLLLLPALYSQTLQAQRPSNGYYEHSGMWCSNYDIEPVRARVAVFAALASMHMPVSQEGFFAYGSFLDTKTVDNFETRITILPVGSAGTRVCVRIGGFGTHRQVCARILDEVGQHMDAARRGPPPPPVLVVPAPAGMPGLAPLIILPPGSSVPRPPSATPPPPPSSPVLPPPPDPVLPPPTPLPPTPVK